MATLRTNTLRIIFILAVCSVYCSPLDAAAKDQLLEECLAGMCINNAKSLKPLVLKKFGSGEKSKEGHEIVHCYRIKGDGAWLSVSFDIHSQQLTSIIVSSVPLCKTRNAPQIDMPSELLRTSLGIRLGSSPDETIRLYGNPSRTDDAVERERLDSAYKNTIMGSRFGNTVYMYLDSAPNSLTFNAYHHTDNRIVTIRVSAQE